MFHSARIRLTLWYLLIIILITGLFSFVIYTNVNQEFNRIERIERVRQQERETIKSALGQFHIKLQPSEGLAPRFLTRHMDPEMVSKSRMRFLITLGIVDIAILFLAGFAGYFLAGRTLKPIKQMLDEQNRFITDASHELRTPLTSLKSVIEVNLRDTKLTLSQAKNVLKSNLEDVNDLQILSDSLIQLSQYPNGHAKSFEKIEIGTILAEVEKKIKALAKAKNIAVIYKKSPAVIFGEKQSLIELFVILLDNAIKYSNEKTSIVLTIKQRDGRVLIEIVDQGMGIAEKDIPYIFDRFYRADKSRTKTEVSGYGLGLSIAKHIVSLHSGSIQVTSSVGKGSTFVVMLAKA